MKSTALGILSLIFSQFGKTLGPELPLKWLELQL